jgi:nucleotide-binding universal stress UspA family protein
MAHKVLIALDSSEAAWRAVCYTAEVFSHNQGVHVTLLHVLSGLPPAFWDDGHILNDQEKESRQRLVASWQEEQEKQWLGLVKKANGHLIQGGVPQEAVADVFRPKDWDVAEAILNEAEAGNFDTIVMGRRGLGLAKSLLLGSITQKVVQNAKGCAVIIVE